MAIRLVTSILIWDIIFKTVRKTSSSVISIGSALLLPSNSHSTKSDRKLEILHLEGELNILQEHLNDLNVSQSDSNSVRLAEQSIRQIIEQMKNLILKIYEKCNQHKKKWFYTWRTLDYSEDYQKIIDLHYILDKRMRLLKQLL